MKIKLLILLSLSNHFEKFKSNFKSYKWIYEYLPGYKESSLRAATSALISNGDIEKIVKNGVVHFSLTQKGWNFMKHRFRAQDNIKKWDGKWRIIVFDIPEKRREEREKIREFLNRHGFGRISNSIYVSPFTLNQWPDSSGLNIFTFEAKTGSLIEDKRLARIAFNLGSLERNYRDWTHSTGSGFDPLIYYYDTILRNNPGLPEELMPTSWSYKKIWNTFLEIVTQKHKDLEKTGENLAKKTSSWGK